MMTKFSSAILLVASSTAIEQWGNQYGYEASPSQYSPYDSYGTQDYRLQSAKDSYSGIGGFADVKEAKTCENCNINDPYCESCQSNCDDGKCAPDEYSNTFGYSDYDSGYGSGYGSGFDIGAGIGDQFSNYESPVFGIDTYDGFPSFDGAYDDMSQWGNYSWDQICESCTIDYGTNNFGVTWDGTYDNTVVDNYANPKPAVKAPAPYVQPVQSYASQYGGYGGGYSSGYQGLGQSKRQYY